MNITLTPDIEQALVEQAQQQGTSPELLALDYLRERFVPAAPAAEVNGQGTLADFLAGSIGVLSSSEYRPGGAEMSVDTGDKFAAGMLKKREQGHL